jgi:hypothetical protein
LKTSNIIILKIVEGRALVMVVEVTGRTVMAEERKIKIQE